MAFAPTWLRQVSPLHHMTTLTTETQNTISPSLVLVEGLLYTSITSM